MNNVANQKKNNRYSKGILGTVLVILIILTLISAALLTVRLINYISVDDREVLLKSDLDAELDVFSAQYNNATGEITVLGMDGQKVVAPGTKVEYTIRLRNTDKTAIDYRMIPDVQFTSDHSIPVLVRMIAPDGSYIVGDEKTWVKTDDLNALDESGTLKKRESVEYVFQWKWDFESGDDAYDTLLGNETFSSDVGLSVEFTLHAEANTDVETNGGFMDSGLGGIALLGLIVLLLIVALVLLIVYMVKKREGKPGDMSAHDAE